MKRRNFIALPAASVLLPGIAGRASIAAIDATIDPQARKSDPRFQQRLHPDFSTDIPGVEYFPLGNGEIIGMLQYAPDRSTEPLPTFLGLTLMDAERFARKWSTFLFHPERGFERSATTVTAEGKNFSAAPGTLLSIGWTLVDGVPVVAAVWKAGVLEVREEFSVPHRGQILFRTITVTNGGDAPVEPAIHLLLVPNFALFDEISVSPGSVNAEGFARLKLYALDGEVTTAGRYEITVKPGPVAPGGKRAVRFVYALNGGEKSVNARTYPSLWKDTVRYWSEKRPITSNNETIDRLYGMARNGLKAIVANSGKRDSGIWMYNMEWVRDDVMVALGMLQGGFYQEARTLFTKILETSVGDDGRTIESSRWFGYDYTELDQNGELLYGIWQYACWTGDRAFLKKYWNKIRLAGDFPLQERFLDPKAGMLHNKREFWERNDSFGLEDGFEIAYQFWVAIGLGRCAEVAEWLDDRKTADRWRKASAALQDRMLNDPVYRLVEDGHFIKRRTRDGRWQRVMVPPNRNAMPPGSPAATLEKPYCDPDTANVYPIIFEMVDPRGALAQSTLASMEQLWNQKWDFGGYSRYNTDSEPDPPAPWPFASLFVARAYAESGDSEKVWRVLRWLEQVHGGKSGGWFERYGPSITPPAPPVCIVGWTYAEITSLIVHHILGFRPGIHDLVVRPRLLEGVNRIAGTFAVHGAEIHVTIERTGAPPQATVDGRPATLTDGSLRLKYPARGSVSTIRITV